MLTILDYGRKEIKIKINILIGGLDGSNVLKSIFAYVKRIDERMDRIEKILKDQSSNSVTKNIESLDEDFYSQLNKIKL